MPEAECRSPLQACEPCGLSYPHARDVQELGLLVIATALFCFIYFLKQTEKSK